MVGDANAAVAPVPAYVFAADVRQLSYAEHNPASVTETLDRQQAVEHSNPPRHNIR